MWSVETGRRPLRLAEASDLAKVLHIQVTDLLRSEAESAVLTYSDRILEVHLLKRLETEELACRPGKIPAWMALVGHDRQKPLTCGNAVRSLGCVWLGLEMLSTVEPQ